MNFGAIISNTRNKFGLTLQEVSDKLSVDKGLLSKIERGQRRASKKLLYRFIDFYNLPEDQALISWLSDKILYELKDHPFALDAMKLAESSVKYSVRDFEFDGDAELHELLCKADELKDKWCSKRPLDQTQLSKMKEHFDLNYTYESNKIEGNTLTLQETFLVVKEGLTVSGKSMNEHLEAVNHAEAIDFIVDVVKRKELVTERLLQEIHYLILKGINRENAGRYRNVPVAISGSEHKPPQPYLVEKQMEDVFEFYRDNHLKIHPIVLAAEMHERIVSVHPFIDGNGRTSRLMMNLILLMNGYTIAIIKGEDSSRFQYYNSLEEVHVNNNRLPFYKLVANRCVDSLNDHIALAG
ncbi:MAG: Fic family protein [Crocinitomicaceae bacterium]